MKRNWRISVGLLLFGVSMTADHIFKLPEFFSGLLLGLSLCLLLFGALAGGNGLDKLRAFKRNLLRLPNK